MDKLKEVYQELFDYRQEVAKDLQFQSPDTSDIWTPEFREGYLGGLTEGLKKLEQHIKI